MQHEKKGFGYVYKAFMRNPMITIEAKAIFNYLSSFAGDKNECYPGKDLMLSELNISEQRFDKHMKILINNGYVKKKRLRVNGKLSNNLYIINAFPNTLKNNLHLEIQGIEIQGIENQGMENLRLEIPCMENEGDNSNSLNTNSSNINSKGSKSRPQKRKHGEYKHVLLTEEEKERLISEYGQTTFDECIRKLDEYIETSGKNYKNHNLVIRNWVIKAVKEDEVRNRKERKGYGKTYDTGNFYSTDFYKQFTSE